MSDDTPRRSGVWERLWRAAATVQTSLFPRILLAFLVVLAVSSIVTLLLENRLTRDALREQAASLLANDLEVVAAHNVSNQTRLATQIRTVAETLSLDLDRPGARQRLIEAITQLQRSASLSLVNVFDPSGNLVAQTGEELAPPPPQAFEELLASDLEGVVPTVDGGWVQMVATAVGRGPEPYMLVAGEWFGDARAFELRNLTGIQGVLLVVDGEVVGATSIGLEAGTPPGDIGMMREPQEVALQEGEALLSYHPVSRSSAVWGADASVGLLLPSPLGRLDASLFRNRLAMVVILISVAGVLAWLSTRLVIRPLERLAETAQQISRGDLAATFEHEDADEIGVLADSLERMRRTLLAQLEVIGRQAQALQRATERVVTVQDEERRRLSRDLHDGLQQRLVMLRLELGRLTSRTDPDVRQSLDEIADEVDRVIALLRETGQAIFPSILQDRGLSGGLRSLSGRSPVPLEVDTDPDPLPRFARDFEANVYFIVAEAVTNVLKHADATRVQARVVLEAEHLVLEVTDDGTGFDTAAAGGSGLAHMHDRARALRGELAVTSGPDGTRVRGRFPVRSVPATEEEQHGGDPAVEVGLVREPELAEDGVGVLLDRPLGDVELPGDRGVATP